tara:strand:+ start:2730 stop:2939 length:210 start_codon:yes stop_codon:yes gene_type:complete
MEGYINTLDLLFDSNYNVTGPDALRRIMKQHLEANKDMLVEAEYVINVWKKGRLASEQNDLARKALELI